MNDAELRAIVLTTLTIIAPEIDPAALDARQPLRLQVDLDSIDWLNLLIALQQQLRVTIPEAEYVRLVSLDDLVAYLQVKVSATR